MGYIKEPKGIDFIIKSRSLTKDEEMAISNFISTYKAKQNRTTVKKRKKPSTKKYKSIN